jgi:hypothetical protein
MAKFKVLRPIEHNLKLYLPELPDALPTAKSAGHGGDIPLDASGTIELEELAAAALIDGQIPLDESGKPLAIEEKERKRRETEEKKSGKEK